MRIIKPPPNKKRHFRSRLVSPNNRLTVRYDMPLVRCPRTTQKMAELPISEHVRRFSVKSNVETAGNGPKLQPLSRNSFSARHSGPDASPRLAVRAEKRRSLALHDA